MQNQAFIDHLIEIRRRLLYSVALLLVVFIVFMSFANETYTIIAQPLIAVLPDNSHLIATNLMSTFLTPLKLALFASFLITLPFTLYQIWAFLAPGLYRHEKKLITPLVITSLLLFYCGMAFCYFLVMPMVFNFFTHAAADVIEIMPDMATYLGLVLKLLLAFGFAFEIPVLIIMLIHSGIVSAQTLAAKRPYVIVGCFIIAMLLTPPDIISQVMLAMPMLLLFEVGLLFSRGIGTQQNKL